MIYKLEEVCEFINGGAWSDKEYVPQGLPVLKVTNCKPKGFLIDDINYLPTSSATKYAKHKVQRGDVIIATVGSHPNLVDSAAGRSCIINSQVDGFYLNQNAVCIRTKDDDVLDQGYLGYHAKYREFQHYIQMRGRGAANQMRIAIGAIKGYEFDFPEIDIQRKIAYILSAYDNLIENNQKQIKLLEEAAQRLYKEWFVDLRFPGHENTPIIDGVPEGWAQCRLEDVIHFNPKVTLSKDRCKQSIPMSALSTTSMVLNTDEFTTTFSNSGSKFKNGDTLLARITPCLENGKTAFINVVESDEGAVGSTEFIVMRANGISRYMVYLLARTENFRQEAINSMTGSDGRQRAQVDKIKVLPYLKPSARIIQAFEKSVAPLFAQIQIKNDQCGELKESRDRLLPKLMSGEIEV